MNTQAFYKCSLAQSMDHLSAHKRDELQTEVKNPRLQNLEGDFGTMQHSHFCLTNLKKKY
jgi:hypothetical protein